MANVIDANGIQIETYQEIVNDIVNGNVNAPGLITIYGPTINVASNSPDGQMVNIYALSKQDILNLCVSIYDSFDPDQAVGVSLDSIAQIAGLARKQGVYTQVVIDIVASATVNISGLDTSTPYLVSDSTGNQFALITSASLIIGTNSLNFQAVNIGYIQILANTITQQITVVAGITSVNNPATPYVVGVNQETDANFRIRRQASTAFPGQGPLQALFAGLNSYADVTQAVVYENITNAVDADGIPAHGIWVIVDGGTAAEIANAIYRYRSLGIDMKGAISVVVTQVNGAPFTVKYDVAVNEPLYIRAVVDSINGGTVDVAAIKQGLLDNYKFLINQEADVTTLDTQIRAINPLAFSTNLGVSYDGITYFDIISPTLKKNKFVLSIPNMDITT